MAEKRQGGDGISISIDGKLAWCVRRACGFEGVSPEEWLRSIVETTLLRNTGYHSVDELYDDNFGPDREGRSER